MTRQGNDRTKHGASKPRGNAPYRDQKLKDLHWVQEQTELLGYVIECATAGESGAELRRKIVGEKSEEGMFDVLLHGSTPQMVRIAALNFRSMTRHSFERLEGEKIHFSWMQALKGNLHAATPEPEAPKGEKPAKAPRNKPAVETKLEPTLSLEDARRIQDESYKPLVEAIVKAVDSDPECADLCEQLRRLSETRGTIALFWSRLRRAPNADVKKASRQQGVATSESYKVLQGAHPKFDARVELLTLVEESLTEVKPSVEDEIPATE